jgi:hypothetical protein
MPFHRKPNQPQHNGPLRRAFFLRKERLAVNINRRSRVRKCEDKVDALEATMKELITERVLARFRRDARSVASPNPW